MLASLFLIMSNSKALMEQAVVRSNPGPHKNKKPHNEERYVKNLRNIPKEPQE
jgi:hypothetical protein